MITIQGKEFRNFAEQVMKNKEDIANKTSSPDAPTGGALKAYRLRIDFQYGDYDLNTRTSYGYAIVYMTAAEAEQRQLLQNIPNFIQFTCSIRTANGDEIMTDIMEYQPNQNRLISPSVDGIPTLLVSTVQYQEFEDNANVIPIRPHP